MPVFDDQQGWKTCVQVYNPAGLSIEFAMVRSSPQRFDSVLSIVVWCGVQPHPYPESRGSTLHPDFRPFLVSAS
ncbi:MAG TPA: hypothetical protein PKW99_13770, partial [Thauera sp.]|nr:hypothetical protein [Thauera sp.]